MPACAAATRRSSSTAQAGRRRVLRAVPARALSERRRRRRARRARDRRASAIARWDRGVDTRRFDPDLRRRAVAAGRADGALRGPDQQGEEHRPARRRVRARPRSSDPRLHLVLAGGGPEQPRLAARLGDRATLPRLARGRRRSRAAYASADAFCFPSETDTFGQVVLEAQASGLPVSAVDAGGPRELITDGVERPAATGPRRRARRRVAVAGRLARATAAARARRPSQRRGADVGASARAPRRRLPRRA